ncbi:MAG: DUF5700 domain-containing putative Zn-dependent protease [Bacillota bacterium]
MGCLFATPGYRALTVSEFCPGFFQVKWRLAFKPELARERQEALALGRDRFLAHYVHVGQRRAELVEYEEQLGDDDRLLARARSLAEEYLPAGDYAYYPVSFVIFDRDARGYRPVVVDLLNALDQGERLVYLLAHELHHYYVGMLRRGGITDQELADTRSDLAWIVDQIQLEGVADLTNVLLWFGQGQVSPEYLDAVAGAPAYLRQLERGLEAVSRDRGLLGEVSRQLRQDLL